MPKRNRLTNNSDETELASLLSGDNIFSIPYFQRAYKWKSQRLKQLESDILGIVDGTSDLHFLGAIIIHGRRSNPADPNVYDVIDGQQRITTLFLYIAAAVKQLIDLADYSQASGIFLKYLGIGRETTLASNIKLHPCKEDRNQFNSIVDDLLSDELFTGKLGSFQPKFLPSSGKENGTMRTNYGTAKRFFKSQYEQGGSDRVRAIYQAILDSISIVQIDVWDPTNGPKIFNALNSRQEPMTIGDLVRNEIFSRVADQDPGKIEQIDQEHWQPFYTKFEQNGKNLFDSYFFPYGLTKNPNLSKSQVYEALRDDWKETQDPSIIIKNLCYFQDAFIDISCGTNKEDQSKKIFQRFLNIWLSNAPSSIYPFLMQLSRALKENAITESDGQEVLDIIESFLVRRAVCGQEPTGLHAVFKRLWVDCDANPSGERVIKEIKKHRTVVWPNDQSFKDAILNREMYGVRITNYILLEYNKSLGGDQPNNIPWIEHVLPTNPSKPWFKKFSKTQHKIQKDLLANLIPLSEEMNKSLSNKPYSEKRKTYLDDSMFKTARQFAKSNKDWTPELIQMRGKALAKWAIKRWPH